MFSFSSGHSGNQRVKKSLSLSSWSLFLVNSVLKTPFSRSVGVTHTADLWQLWAFCYHLLSPSLVFLTHLLLHTQNSTKTISWPQVCLLLPVKHLRQYSWVSEEPQYNFCFGKQLLLLELRPICLEWRMAVIASNSVIFCRSGRAWVEQVAELVPFSSQSPPEWFWNRPYFQSLPILPDFNCVGWNVMLQISTAV